jgi:hypothetical protein
VLHRGRDDRQVHHERGIVDHAEPVNDPDLSASSADGLDAAPVDDLAPLEMDCLRCRGRAPMRFAGLCPQCRDELRAKYPGVGRETTAVTYEPKRHVTPNAVALRED